MINPNSSHASSSYRHNAGAAEGEQLATAIVAVAGAAAANDVNDAPTHTGKGAAAQSICLGQGTKPRENN
jgi:hypothetical protein